MTLTEEEAKTKWCPFARIGGSAGMDGASYNRIEHHGGDISHTAANCIGSACMAWRWVPQIGVQHDLRSPHGTPGQQYISGNTDRGFCGLANPPAYLGE